MLLKLIATFLFITLKSVYFAFIKELGSFCSKSTRCHKFYLCHNNVLFLNLIKLTLKLMLTLTSSNFVGAYALAEAVKILRC